MKENIWIILVNYKSYNDTVIYVNELLKQERVNLNVAIIDNDSKNGSFEFLSDTFYDATNVSVYHSTENLGYARGNNLGISLSNIKKNELVIISNNDLVIKESDFLYKWIKSHRNIDNVGITAPAMRVGVKLSPHMAWKIPRYIDSVKASLASIELLFGNDKMYLFDNQIGALKVECVPGSLFMIEKNTLDLIGCFDENTFLYMEEVILSRKLKNIGKFNYLLRDIEYEHLVSKTISSELSSRSMRNYLVESVIYYHREYDKISFFKVLLLKCLFKVWCLENFIIRKIKLFKGN